MVRGTAVVAIVVVLAAFAVPPPTPAEAFWDAVAPAIAIFIVAPMSFLAAKVFSRPPQPAPGDRKAEQPPPVPDAQETREGDGARVLVVLTDGL